VSEVCNELMRAAHFAERASNMVRPSARRSGVIE
jgi:hypothetical protein